MGARADEERSLICRLGRPAGLVTGDVVVDMVLCFFAGAGVVGERGCLSVETSVRGGVEGADMVCAVLTVDGGTYKVLILVVRAWLVPLRLLFRRDWRVVQCEACNWQVRM